MVIELAPQFAPHHVANIEALARAKYFDGLADRARAGQLRGAVGRRRRPRSRSVARRRTLAAEFERPLRGLAITQLPDPDTYAPRGRIRRTASRSAARSASSGAPGWCTATAWSGAGRDNDVDSGGGTELYVVIGQAPRHLDRNVTLLGRVVAGHGAAGGRCRAAAVRSGFYEHPEQRVPIRSVQLAADVPRGAAHASSRCCAPTRRPSSPTSRRAATATRNGSRCRPGASTCATCRSRCGRAVRRAACSDLSGAERCDPDAAARAALQLPLRAARARAGSSAGAARAWRCATAARSICRRCGRQLLKAVEVLAHRWPAAPAAAPGTAASAGAAPGAAPAAGPPVLEALPRLVALGGRHRRASARCRARAPAAAPAAACSTDCRSVDSSRCWSGDRFDQATGAGGAGGRRRAERLPAAPARSGAAATAQQRQQQREQSRGLTLVIHCVFAGSPAAGGCGGGGCGGGCGWRRPDVRRLRPRGLAASACDR